MKITTGLICRTLMIINYAAILTGFLLPAYVSLAVKLFPWHLLLVFGLLLISQQGKNRNFFLFILLLYAAGFIVELFGVHTGRIFGNYHYLKALGIQFAEVPLVIGVSWCIWIYSTGIVISGLGMKHPVVNAAAGALVLTVFAILREPVVIKFNFLAWNEMEVPFQNYAAWFVFSFLMLRLFFEIEFKKRNNTAFVLLVCQFLFFIALNLWAF